MTGRRAWRPGALAVCLALGACGDRAGDAPVVFAAASTADVVREIADSAVVSVAATSTLARQIAAGAPADAFVAADPAWIDWLVERGVTVRARAVVATGAVVIVGPAGAAEAFDGDRFALADPAHVPAGRYARRALEAEGRWAEVAPRVVPLGDVRAALAAVQTGAADRAVVYASDADAAPGVAVLHRFGATVRPRFEVAALTARGERLARALAADRAAWAAAGFAAADP